MLHLLQEHDIVNVVVVVARWYGGHHLGPDRFVHITKAATEVLSTMMLITSAETASPSNHTKITVDNLLLHDSTAKHIDIDKLFPQNQESLKKWSPYIDLASRIIKESVTATKSVILVAGVRHLTQIISGKLTMAAFKDMVNQFVNDVQAMCPTAKTILCSILPSNDTEIKACASDMNSMLQSLAHDSCGKVVYADTASRFHNKQAMLGIHPKKSSIGLMASTLKEALYGRQSSTGPQLPHSNDRHKTNQQGNRQFPRHNSYHAATRSPLSYAESLTNMDSDPKINHQDTKLLTIRHR